MSSLDGLRDSAHNYLNSNNTFNNLLNSKNTTNPNDEGLYFDFDNGKHASVHLKDGVNVNGNMTFKQLFDNDYISSIYVHDENIDNYRFSMRFPDADWQSTEIKIDENGDGIADFRYLDCDTGARNEEFVNERGTTIYQQYNDNNEMLCQLWDFDNDGKEDFAYSYDDKGNEKEYIYYSYDDNGNITKKEVYDSKTDDLKSATTYDEFGIGTTKQAKSESFVGKIFDGVSKFFGFKK